MADYGVTPYGFVRKPLIPIIDDMKGDAQDGFGNDVNLDNDSLIYQYIAINAEQFDQVWQGMEGVYNAQTVNGAEGVYLDDVFSSQGVYRQPKQPSTGFAYLTTDGTTPVNTNLPATSRITTNVNIQYLPSVGTAITDNIYGAKVHTDDVVLNEVYNITCISEVTGTSASISVTATTEEEKYTEVVLAIYNFVSGCHPSLSSHIQLETIAGGTTTGAFYIGYDTNYELNPLTGSVLLIKTPTINLAVYKSLGTRVTRISVEAKDSGLVTVPANSLTGIDPVPVGYLDIVNTVQMTSGSDVETDAEYRFRYTQIIDLTSSSTRNAVEGALLQLEGVTKVRIYENTTDTDTPEAESYSFNSVILGGDSNEIFQTLFDKKPINVRASGSVCGTVLSSQSDATIVCYTPATNQKLSTRITYTTKNNADLTTQEQSVINDALTVFSASMDIGDPVLNGQLQSYVYRAAPDFDTFLSVLVEVKEVSQPDSSYSNADYLTAYDEVAVIDPLSISYVRT